MEISTTWYAKKLICQFNAMNAFYIILTFYIYLYLYNSCSSSRTTHVGIKGKVVTDSWPLAVSECLWCVYVRLWFYSALSFLQCFVPFCVSVHTLLLWCCQTCRWGFFPGRRLWRCSWRCSPPRPGWSSCTESWWGMCWGSWETRWRRYAFQRSAHLGSLSGKPWTQMGWGSCDGHHWLKFGLDRCMKSKWNSKFQNEWTMEALRPHHQQGKHCLLQSLFLMMSHGWIPDTARLWHFSR